MNADVVDQGFASKLLHVFDTGIKGAIDGEGAFLL